MNYTSPEKPDIIQDHHLQQQQPQAYMPSPHLSSRSSGSTIEEEIENALSQLQVASDVPQHINDNSNDNNKSNNNSNNNINSSNEINKIELWDVEQVADWLKSVGLDSVSANFIGKYHMPKNHDYVNNVFFIS